MPAHAASAGRSADSPRARRPSSSRVQYVDVLVLGAGPTGIGAARRLHALDGPSWLMLDAASKPGGMAITEHDEHGFAWDLGSHVIHSHYDAFNEAIACHDDWVHPHRGGWCRVGDEWIPGPIQRNLGNLGQRGDQIVDEIRAIERSGDDAEPHDLAQYYASKFGPTLDRLFFTPFNFKQWACPLTELNHSWTSLRAGSKLSNVPKPATVATRSYRPSDTSAFPYPRMGTGSLWASIARTVPAQRQRYNARVTAIDLERHQVTLASGETIVYGHCISSLPLNRTIDLVNAHRPRTDLPPALAAELKHSSTSVLGLGFDGPLPSVLEGKTFVFGADADVAFHRASVTSNFSPALADGDQPPRSRWSIMFETSSSEHRPIDISKETLTALHLAQLRRWGAVGEFEQPLSVWYHHLHLGYPVPFLGRDELLLGSDGADGILQRFERFGFYPRGRFGGWRYESSNQDFGYQQGIDAVDLLVSGATESTYWPYRPDKVVVPPRPSTPVTLSLPSSPVEEQPAVMTSPTLRAA